MCIRDRVDSLPGVAGGSSFIGSFDREHAVEDESRDFFASGHALVEGLLAYFDEDPKGRVGRLELRLGSEPHQGLIAIYKDGPEVEVVAFDSYGQARPEWADALRRRAAPVRRMSTADAAGYDWSAVVLRLAPRIAGRQPHAVAAVVVRPE